jgi:myo-inositol 2-dehydrogenase/D-chiro-inositol 1-dehydrogenase
MTIRVGVIGTGLIGADHVERLVNAISGSVVTAVADVDRARAEQVSAGHGGIRVHDDGHALIASPEVDAILVAASSETHPEYTLAAIAAGKPVLCEKPLARTTPECEEVVAAEAAIGRRLVVVGFMRRFDPGYLAVKRSLDGGAIGEALILHNVHRNASAPASFTSAQALTDALIHEIDVTRWLLGEEITAIQVIPPRRTGTAPPHLQDPQFVCLTTANGILSTAEFFANCGYGYDVRCELVGSRGTASLRNPVVADQVADGRVTEPVAPDWRVRFGAAYTSELQAWITGLRRGEIVGPSAWDGYAATRVTELGLEALATGQRVAIEYIEQPAIYR